VVLAWFKNGFWKLRGMRNGSERGRCHLYGEEGVTHPLLKCSEAKKWREQYLSIKWRSWDVACEKIHRTNVAELRKIGNYLYKTGWE
jgi:hypothetical protein